MPRTSRTDEVNADASELAELIKKLRQGEPVTATKIGLTLSDDEVARFGVNNAYELLSLIRLAIESRQQEPEVAALKNALGIDLPADDKRNLTVRRAEYLEEVDITMRGLQNREDAGAVAIAAQIPTLREMRSDDAAIQELQSRVGRLELHVRQLSVALGSVLELLATHGDLGVTFESRSIPKSTSSRHMIRRGDDESDRDALGEFYLDVGENDRVVELIIPDEGLDLIRDLRHHVRQPRRKRTRDSGMTD